MRIVSVGVSHMIWKRSSTWALLGGIRPEVVSTKGCVEHGSQDVAVVATAGCRTVAAGLIACAGFTIFTEWSTIER